MNKPSVYIETTVVSYLIAPPSRDLLVAAHQQVRLIGGGLSFPIAPLMCQALSSRKLRMARLRKRNEGLPQ
jgi:hypothetical protein